MDAFNSFFGLHSKKDRNHPVDIARLRQHHDDAKKQKISEDFTFSEVAVDTKSRNYFRTQNLARSRFSHTTVAKIGWWPDEMLLMIEILLLAYNEFIDIYRSSSLSFDVAIRTAAFFMTQKKYSNIPEIAKFLVHGDYRIPDNYLSIVIAEDNCYVREVEEHARSPNEHKHYLFVTALVALLRESPIVEGELILKKEHEEQLAHYVMIYKLKNMYAITDDILRTALSACLQRPVARNTNIDAIGDSVDIGISLYTTFTDLLVDLDENILIHLRNHHDDQLFTKIHIFRDLLLHTHHATKLFNHVFNFRRLDDNHGEFLLPSGSLDADTTKRLEHLYKFYLHQVKVRDIKMNIVSGKGNFETMSTEINNTTTIKLITPRYVRDQDEVKLTIDEKKSVFIVGVTSPRDKKKRLPGARKASVDIMLRHHHTSVREDVAIIMTTKPIHE